MNYLAGDQFDAVMNYVFTESLIQFTGQHYLDYEVIRGWHSYNPYPSISAEVYADRIDKLMGMYDWEVTQAQLNLLDSHDTPRLLTMTGGDRGTVRLATILLMAFPGAPSIYYGDEIGLPGGRDPDCRRPMPWSKRDTWDMETLGYYKQLIALRHAHPALRRGRYTRLYADQWAYAFGRQLEDDRLVVAVNVADSAKTIKIPIQTLFADGTALEAAFGKATVKVETGIVEVSIPARDGLILTVAG